MKGSYAAIAQIQKVADLLGQDEGGWAESDLRKELASYAESINPDNPDSESLSYIEGLCHVKILGDVSTENMQISREEWKHEISKLEQKCSRLRRKIESLA